jgi:hypothetical protein
MWMGGAGKIDQVIERCEERDEDKRVADNTIKKLQEDISELVMWKKQAVDRYAFLWPSPGPHAVAQ